MTSKPHLKNRAGDKRHIFGIRNLGICREDAKKSEKARRILEVFGFWSLPILWFVGSKDLIFDALVLDTASIGGIISAYSMH